MLAELFSHSLLLWLAQLCNYEKRKNFNWPDLAIHVIIAAVQLD
jgi:hypothetical protein